MKKKLLICGSSGQLGSDAVRVMGDTYELLALNEHELDITRIPDLEDVISSFRPDIILNCAAYTHVDACETEKERARDVNAGGPANISQCVKKHGGTLVHISTDYVFDGTKEPPAPYTEEDETSPLSCYGSTKHEGEAAVRESGIRHMIIRTAWLYGISGKNFLKTILGLVMKRPEQSLKIIHDQYGSPTWSFDLALQIERMVQARCSGTYHATSERHCTWYEFADHFLSRMDVEYSITPCTTEEYPTPAVRPRNSILENSRLNQEGINIMPDWKTGLERFVDTYKTQLLEEAGNR